jgi:hypothetical protein
MKTNNNTTTKQNTHKEEKTKNTNEHKKNKDKAKHANANKIIIPLKEIKAVYVPTIQNAAFIRVSDLGFIGQFTLVRNELFSVLRVIKVSYRRELGRVLLCNIWSVRLLHVKIRCWETTSGD